MFAQEDDTVCHLLLLMPVLGLPVFWLWPIETAAPAYAVIFVVSIWLYGLALRSAHRPVEIGQEAIRQGCGQVVKVHGRKLTVQLGSELWNAESSDRLHAGDEVRVTRVDKLVLTVAKLTEPANDRSTEMAHGA